MDILLVDDHKVLRNALGSTLEEELNAIVTHANNGIEAFNISKKREFDLIISDVNMPQLDGIGLVKKLREEVNKTPVIVLSMMDDSVSIKKMLKAGANGYVLKEGETRELLKAIDKVINGENYFSTAVTETIMTSLSDSRTAHKDAELTKRELEILELLFNELSNQEIADKLFISLRTVETHKHNIMEKTGAKNMAGLVKFAIRHKLFDGMFY